MDQALQNAAARRGAIASKFAQVSEQINELIEQRNKLRAELEEVELFIGMWHKMAGIPVPREMEQKVQIESQEKKRIRPENPPREAVARKCVEYIREAGRPLSRRELFAKLEFNGIEIKGKQPEMVLSTMLWRSQHIIKRLRGGGYWPANEPLPSDYAGDLV